MILQVLTWIEREHNERKGNSFQIIEYRSNHNISERTVKSTVLLNCRKMTDKKEKNYEEHDERISWK